MPAWETSLTPDELMSVVLHERSILNSEEFDIEAWEDGFEEKVEELIPDQAADYIEVLERGRPRHRRLITGRSVTGSALASARSPGSGRHRR